MSEATTQPTMQPFVAVGPNGGHRLDRGARERATSGPAARWRPAPAAPRRIAVVPAYNEEATVFDVLARLDAHPSVDEVVIVDDGSTDNTRAEILRYMAAHPGHRVQLVAFDRNRGMSAAYEAAFRAIGERVARGELAADDLILTVDADGQHDPALLDHLIQIVQDENLAALVAERDLKGSGYTRYKRLGNWLMSAWATLWAGRHWRDVESGFRIFRVGPLLDALQYYKGWKYSETVEVAVILSRLGYQVRNDVTVPVPVFRSRTRLFDVAVDLWSMPAAWWRVTWLRRPPPGIGRRTAITLPLLALVPLALVLLLVASKRVFLGTDSINVYIHVWYLKDQLIDHLRFPVRAAPLDGGRAVALPYGGAVWVLAALLFAFVQEWAVTWTFVLGVVLLPWAAGVARRVLRDPWLLLLFLINPFYVDAIFSFQYAFVWSAVFFFLFVAALDQRRWIWAAVLGWLAAGTHPIMGLPPVVLYLGWSALRRRTPWHVGAALVVGIGAALLPLLWLTLQTPAVGENDLKTIVLSVADVVVRRGTILAVPFAFAAWQAQVRRWWRPLAATIAAGLVVNAVFANGFLGFAQGSYTGIVRTSRDIYRPFVASGLFEPGARYRVLAPNEREDGLYHLARHGAVLTSELFTESMFKRSFTLPEYTCFLRAKRVDFVVVERDYFRQYHTNEQQLLDTLHALDLAQPLYHDPHGRYTVYDVIAAAESGRDTGGQVQVCFR